MRFTSYGDSLALTPRDPSKHLRRMHRPIRGSTHHRLGSLRGVQLQTGQGAGAGAAQGASVGMSFGPIGAVIGAAIGAIVGSIGKKDSEDANLQQLLAVYQAYGPDGVFRISNKYLALAGLFDLHPSLVRGNLPFYKKYGRMGEQKFTTDMANVLYQAGQSGQITANDTIASVKARIFDPWILSFGFGPMSDPSQDTYNALFMGMINDYLIGAAQTSWQDINGGSPFRNLPQFTLAQPAPVVTTTSNVIPTPSGGVQTIVAPVTTPTSSSVVSVPVKPVYSPPPSYTVVGTNSANGHPLVEDPMTQAIYDFNPNTGQLTNFGAGSVAVAQPSISNATNGAVTQSQLAAAVSAALQQGATPQQAYNAGVSYVGGGGAGGPIYATPAVQHAVATEVTAQTSGIPTWAIVGGAALLAVLLIKRRRS